jgi:hypothetical protein
MSARYYNYGQYIASISYFPDVAALVIIVVAMFMHIVMLYLLFNGYTKNRRLSLYMKIESILTLLWLFFWVIGSYVNSMVSILFIGITSGYCVSLLATLQAVELLKFVASYNTIMTRQRCKYLIYAIISIHLFTAGSNYFYLLVKSETQAAIKPWREYGSFFWGVCMVLIPKICMGFYLWQILKAQRKVNFNGCMTIIRISALHMGLDVSTLFLFAYVNLNSLNNPPLELAIERISVTMAAYSILFYPPLFKATAQVVSAPDTHTSLPVAKPKTKEKNKYLTTAINSEL